LQEFIVDAPAGFTIEGNRGYFRPQGEVTLAEAIRVLVGAVEYAKTIQLPELLLDGMRLTGYTQPSVIDRYQFGSSIANIAAGTTRIAVVLPANIIDPNHFGTLVATNRGLETEVFPTEAEALAWFERRS
jgi:hypothetical protein